jgi:hypothetical protein
MSLRLVFKASIGQFDEAFKELYVPGAKAATRAIREIAEIVKSEGRASIAAAGFSKRWQNALRVDVYPGGRTFKVNSPGNYSMNAAAWVYHKIPYAAVFEDGATIRGRPKLWVPLSGTPKKIGRNRMSPKLINERIGRVLFPIKGRGKPLLAIRVRMPASRAAQDRPKVTPAMLRKAIPVGRPAPKGRGVLRSIPLFVGVSSIEVRKRFSIRQICGRAAGRLAELYLKNFEGN